MILCCEIMLEDWLVFVSGTPYMKTISELIWTLTFPVNFFINILIYSTVCMWFICSGFWTVQNKSWIGSTCLVLYCPDFHDITLKSCQIFYTLCLSVIVVVSYTVFTRFIGKLSQRIKSIFWVMAGISFDVLPSLQFIIMFFAFGSGRGGKYTYMNYSEVIQEK